MPYRRTIGDAPGCNTLDVYYTDRREAGTPERSAVVFLHGGNWRRGDKSALYTAEGRHFSEWFVGRGHVFFAANFRLFGQNGAVLQDMLEDAAIAIRWVTQNGGKYGSFSKRVILVGYSSGAHLAALLASQPKFLRRQNLSSSVVSAVIGLDVPFYDVPMAIHRLEHDAASDSRALARLDAAREVMGATKAEQLKVSPAAYLGAWMRHINFLLVSVGTYGKRKHDFSRRLSSQFCLKLRQNGNVARHEHFPNLDHTSLVASFTGDVSSVVEDFLSSQENAAEEQRARRLAEDERAKISLDSAGSREVPKRESGIEHRKECNVSYRHTAGGGQQYHNLDIYYPSRLDDGAPEKSAVIFLHGDIWRGGDKSVLCSSEEQRFPQWFVERGHVFFAVNFRLLGRGGAALDDVLDDVAKAIKWVTHNGSRYGVRSQQITMAGHSSGAHLATLVVAQPKLLRRHHLAPTVISSVIGFDIPPQSLLAKCRGKVAGKVAQSLHLPAAELGPWMRHVKFLLATTGSRHGRLQSTSHHSSQDFALKLRKNGNPVHHEHLPQIDHSEILRYFPENLGSVAKKFLEQEAFRGRFRN